MDSEFDMDHECMFLKCCTECCKPFDKVNVYFNGDYNKYFQIVHEYNAMNLKNLK